MAKIAFRNIFRHKRRSAITCMMMAGGCFLFSIFIGMADGSYRHIIESFTRDHTGHVQVHSEGYLDKPSIYKIIRDPSGLGQKMAETTDILSWAPRVYSPALAFAGKKTSGLKLMGIDPLREAQTTRIAQKITSGAYLPPEPGDGIIIGEGLARLLRVALGDEIALIAQGVDGSVANALFSVIGIIGKSESVYGASRAYVHIDTAREFLSMPGGAHEIALVLRDYTGASGAAASIEAALSEEGIEADPWQVVESQFYSAMQADLKGNWLSIGIIALIVSIGVLNTVLMVILERTREYGVLRALGTRPGEVFSLIVLETAYLALMSIAVGVAAGVLGNWFLSVRGIKLSTPVEWGGFFFDTLTSDITVNTIVIPAALVLGTAILVSIPPAIRAARTRPAGAMRAA